MFTPFAGQNTSVKPPIMNRPKGGMFGGSQMASDWFNSFDPYEGMRRLEQADRDYNSQVAGFVKQAAPTMSEYSERYGQQAPISDEYLGSRGLIRPKKADLGFNFEDMLRGHNTRSQRTNPMRFQLSGIQAPQTKMSGRGY
jgi:hypothetical protein